jgi:hypothetical protein
VRRRRWPVKHTLTNSWTCCVRRCQNEYSSIVKDGLYRSRFFSLCLCSIWEWRGQTLIFRSSKIGVRRRIPSIADKNTSDLPG